MAETLPVHEAMEADGLRSPPANAQAEMGLLGAILINNRAYERVSEFLKPEHFSEALHSRIYEACATIRQTPGGAHVPVVMMTGSDDLESISRAYDAGATDFITKPIRVRDLRRAGPLRPVAAEVDEAAAARRVGRGDSDDAVADRFERRRRVAQEVAQARRALEGEVEPVDGAVRVRDALRVVVEDVVGLVRDGPFHRVRRRFVVLDVT